MKHTLNVLAICLLLAAAVFAQDNGDDLVTVPKKYVSTEGLSHTSSNPLDNKWVGVGKEIGIATKEGLDAVITEADKFGSTKVGTFVMVMIAWRIMGHDILGVLLGVPMLFLGLLIEWYLLRRFYFGYRVLAKKDGKVKEYSDHPAYQFKGDGRVAVGAMLMVGGITWFAVSVVAIFGGM